MRTASRLRLLIVVLWILLTSPYRAVGAEEVAVHLTYEDGPLLEVEPWGTQNTPFRGFRRR